MRLSGKTALITGGARGQGAAHGRRLAEEGAAVILGDILDDAGEAHARELRAAGHDVHYLRLDVTTPSGTNSLYYLADWGVLLLTKRGIARGAVGAPSLAVSVGVAIVTGFTAYKNVGTSTTCPAPILR